MAAVERGEVLCENPLAGPSDVEGWQLEGDAAVTFPLGRMRMGNLRSPEEGQAANFVHWCPQDFADGKIGFRQMAPLMAEYASLTVYALT